MESKYLFRDFVNLLELFQ